MNPLLGKLGIALPIVQAPMAGTSTPAMAAGVSNAGGLGSIGVGATDANSARAMIGQIRERSNRAFNVNLFCHKPAVANAEREAAWLERLKPLFAEFDAEPPKALHEIYKSFVEDDAMLAMLLETRPAVISFHFGLPPSDRIKALHDAGIVLLASATNMSEARQIEAAEIDAIVAQGYEAGGHRGMFDPAAHDDRLGTMALTRLLVKQTKLPVIAAGGIMDGAGIAAALTLGASAAQLGTAFIACPESAADAAYRARVLSPAAEHTTLTTAISGRPARAIVNRFTAFGETVPPDALPAYPIVYDAGKALNAAAKAKGESGYGAQWAGQAARLARALPAAELVAVLKTELDQALAC
ncbi:MAG TPA: nitronate monooxygenase [Rhizomicrobium sp.]|jgi:nitronate monooxygenase